MHYASHNWRRGYFDVAKLQMAHVATPQLQDMPSKTAIAAARGAGNDDILDLFDKGEGAKAQERNC